MPANASTICASAGRGCLVMDGWMATAAGEITSIRVGQRHGALPRQSRLGFSDESEGRPRRGGSRVEAAIVEDRQGRLTEGLSVAEFGMLSLGEQHGRNQHRRNIVANSPM